MTWIINYTESAKKQLKKLDKPIARHIVDHMEQHVALLDNPRCAGKALKGPLGEFWRYRVGNYCVMCDIQNQLLTVLVVKIGHRKDIYSSSFKALD